jgi:spore coat protein H
MTNRFLFLLSFIFLLHFNANAQNAGDSVFAGIQVHSINIHFDQSNYWDSLIYYYLQGNEQYMAADVTLNGLLLDSCGVRIKGNSSYNHPNNKKSLKIAFDQYRDEQRWDGLKSIHLNNCYGDPTFMREKIHLDFCRDAGICAPRANFANVHINDTLFAFYSMVESVDKKFLKTHYDDNNGDLFKAIDGFFNFQIVSDFKWYTSVPDSYYIRYELKTEDSQTAWPRLVTLLDTINNSSNVVTALPTQINLNPLYKAIAADILFANLDSYVHTSRNFYFYFHPQTDLMEWIVWDVGLSFGGYGGGVSNFENLNVNYIISSIHRPLIGKIFNNAILKSEYLYALCVIFNAHFSNTALSAKIDNIAGIIRPFVYADPRKMYTNTQFEINLITDLNIGGVGGGNRIPGLKSFIQLRETSVQNQLSNLGIDCSTPVGEETGNLPEKFILLQNYPNPFNSSTLIEYQLPQQAYVQLKIYNLLGQEVSTLIDQQKDAGYYLISFDAGNLPSGIYFYSLTAGELNQTKRMIILK